jgi:poly-gamma-glutamate capsule biosynthesis protein CapA/YwtB (metallophosphatase superfamily)
MLKTTGFLILFFLLNGSMISATAYPGDNPPAVTGKDSASSRMVTITGVGDIMLGSGYPNTRRLPPHDNANLLLEVIADTLRSSDITFGNLEGSFLDSGAPVKKCRDTTICYLFRMPEKYISALTNTGFDILSVANNHFGDFGPAGRVRTKKILDSVGIYYAGLIEHPYVIFEKDSLRYGFCAFAPNSGTLNLNETAGAAALVRKLADTCDIVIVSFHGGAEGADYQHVPRKHEIFHGEDRGDVCNFARTMIDNGADVVFGHGPHVTRAVEVYRDRFISYSMGNFCTYGGINLAGPNGLAPVIRLTTESNGRFVSGRIIPVYQEYPGGVKYDHNRRVINRIRDLMSADFPESQVQISASGEITYKQ